MFQSVRVGSGGEAEAVVLGVFRETEPNSGSSPWFSNPAVQAALKRREFTGKVENIVEVFPHDTAGPTRLFLIGLGKRQALDGAALRKAAAGLGRRLAKTQEATVSLDLAEPLSRTGIDLRLCGQCFGESMGLLAWNGRLYRGSGSEPPTLPALTMLAPDTTFADGLERGLQLAASANRARDLSQTPPNIATPLWIAEQAATMAAEVGLRCRVLQGVELEQERLVGLRNVGKASENAPCLIRLEYRPERADGGKRPVVFIGKTITYDTGGLTLKINNGMVGMKRDKDGGCAVLGAMHAIATLLKPNFPVVGLLAAAENAISEDAYRPDDVLTYRNGVTVEVTNTDAEGRLVLADALCWACEVENAACIVDLATLTGGVITALGSTYAGLFCDDEPLRSALEQAGAQSGERLWRLPMHEEYRDMLKSPVADIVNSNPNRKAHPIQGAAFLSYFVKEGTPWAHIDIAGVHVVDGDVGPFIKGPTGFGVRLLAELVTRLPCE
jgi:leucyl aminopeptidase